MKLRIAFLLTLALCFSASAFAGDPDYTIKAPDGWKKRTTSSAPEHYMKNGVTLMLTIDSAPPEAKNLDAYVEFAKKQYAGTLQNLTFDPARKLTINGVDARELVYTGEASGFKMKYDVVYVMRQTKVYTLTAGGMAGTFDSMKADYQSFFSSFKLK
ncbi:MAG TPA: DcrB-related protein [Bacteroidota bacterium]|nr:DcrB-related protein [Bacteroidota bacterium]